MHLFITETLNLELFLREREPKSLEQASKLADQYKEARYTDILNFTFNTNERSRSSSRSNGHIHLLFEGIIIKTQNLLEAHVLFVEIKTYSQEFCPEKVII